jgi:hypothetical protein
LCTNAAPVAGSPLFTWNLLWVTRRLTSLFAALVAMTAAVAAAVPSASTARKSRIAPVVIAVVENGGLNVLHDDYRMPRRGVTARAPDVLNPRTVFLPDTGGFEQRLEAGRRGPLGKLTPGTLYRIAGTKIAGVYVPEDTQVTDLFADMTHATGTTSSAVGNTHGTNPDATLVYVVDSGPAAWEWVAAQSWIDLVSTSYFGGGSRGTCVEGPYIEEIVEGGRVVFSSSGNGEQAGLFSSPSGVPSTYQVGGVDASGRSYVPGASGTSGSIMPTRPYETGDRFDFPAAAADSLDGSQDFGGTSGAAPSTTGRAAHLIQVARSILGSRWTGVRDGALARATDPGLRPARGPLADGDLTGAELVDLLHHTARPAEPASPLRYLVEGYGAHDADTVALAERVLRGLEEIPERPDDDTMHDHVESSRSITTAHCG